MNFHDAFDIDASLDKGDGRAYVSVRSALYTMGKKEQAPQCGTEC